MLPIPDEIRRALQDAPAGPLRLLNQENGQEYVLVQAEQFDRVSAMLYDDSPLTDEERRHLLVQAGLRAGWNDPEMDVYNDLDPRREA